MSRRLSSGNFQVWTKLTSQGSGAWGKRRGSPPPRVPSPPPPVPEGIPWHRQTLRRFRQKCWKVLILVEEVFMLLFALSVLTCCSSCHSALERFSTFRVGYSGVWRVSSLGYGSQVWRFSSFRLYVLVGYRGFNVLDYSCQWGV